MTKTPPALLRAQAFSERCGLRVPILLGPMAGGLPACAREGGGERGRLCKPVDLRALLRVVERYAGGDDGAGS